MQLGERVLFHPILDFGECFTGTRFIELAPGSATHSNRADGDPTGHNGHPTGRISDIGQWRLRHRTWRILAHPVGDGFRAVFLTRKRQRRRRVGLIKRIIERVDRRPVAPEQGLANAVEIDDDRCHRVTLPRAACDRLAHKLIRKRRRQFLHIDQPLSLRSRRASAHDDDKSKHNSLQSCRNL
jgi:hypothetical protein